MPKGYAIYLAKNNREVRVVEFPIQQYTLSRQLLRFLNEHKKDTISCSDLKTAGFEDITGNLMYPTRPMGQSGRSKMPDDAQIVLDDKGIQEILDRMVAYNNYKASERIDMNRLIHIDYYEQMYENSVERIEKCIQHFHQLAEKLQSIFADVPGVSFVIGEEEVQYANLYFRILYKGRYFLQILGRFGNATFIHIVNSKHRFPKWDIVIRPYEEACQLHNTFKDIHKQNVYDDEVIQNVTASYKGRFDQYAEVKEQVRAFFNIELEERDFEYDIVRECIMLHEEAERKVIAELIPESVDKDKKEFYKYTTLETFMKIFQNRTIRMNSVVAMNDTSETNILQDAVRNFTEPIESEADAYLESNTRFITSFTALEDSLPMWTQYGNKGTGVCLVFERGSLFKENDLIHIKYISKNDETVIKIKKMLAALKNNGINFYFALLDKYRNFIKYDFYKSEDEYRYLVVQEIDKAWTLNSDYNIVAPYIDRRIIIGNTERKNSHKHIFPFVLRRVIMGPAMKNQKYNVWQLNYIASRNNIWNFKVEPSRIDSFR